MTDPKGLVPGIEMSLRLDNTDERADIIAYLTYNDYRANGGAQELAHTPQSVASGLPTSSLAQGPHVAIWKRRYAANKLSEQCCSLDGASQCIKKGAKLEQSVG